MMYGVIDWELSEINFEKSIDEMIVRVSESGNVLVLPFKITPGEQFFNIIVAVLSQIDCKNCDARCCTSNPPTENPIEMTAREYYDITHEKSPERLVKISYPCRFLNENNQCSAYNNRPMVCVMYPLQTGGMSDGSLAVSLSSHCPEARRITKNIYMERRLLRDRWSKHEKRER